MKRNKKLISEREVKFTERCRLDLSLLCCGKRENEWYMRKKMIVMILLMKYLFKLTNYTNWGWFDSIRFMSKNEN